MSALKVPAVDPPVASLSSSSIPVDGDCLSRDCTNRKTEVSLKCNFELSAFTFRAASANSVMSRAAFIWAEELADMKKLPKAAKMKKLPLAAAFTADAFLDAMHLTLMSSNFSARRALWLHSWKGDAGAFSELINTPFEGGKLFGASLDAILVETRDKRKILNSQYCY